MAACNFSDADVLHIFVESVEELLDSSYLTQLKSGGLSNSYKWSRDAGGVSERVGPDRDAVKAFLLTLRFFGQNNEPTSLCNMEARIDKL